MFLPQVAVKLANINDPSIIYNSSNTVHGLKDGVENYFYSTNINNDTYYLYFISKTHSKNQQISFNKLSITPIPTKDTLIMYCQSSYPALSPIIPFTVTKKSPTQYILKLEKTNLVQGRVLLFNQSFHPLWGAYTFVNGKKHYFNHMVQNGYANAWLIDSAGDGNVYIDFSPQKETEYTAVGSTVLFILLCVCFLVIRKKRKDIL
jgi:hypothetical protein